MKNLVLIIFIFITSLQAEACKFKSAQAAEDNTKEFLAKRWKEEPQFSVASTQNLPYRLGKITKIEWGIYEIDLHRGNGRSECRRARYNVSRDSMCVLSATLTSLSGCGGLPGQTVP